MRHAETLVQEQQQREHQRDRRQQHDHQTAERDLLLLVQAAQLVVHALRQQPRWRPAPSCTSAIGRAQVAAADAAGHGDHALEVLARDLRLARAPACSVATRDSGNTWPSARADRQLRRAARCAGARCRRQPARARRPSCRPRGNCVATVPSTAAAHLVGDAVRVEPSSAALAGSTCTVSASPAGLMPSRTPTTPLILPICVGDLLRGGVQLRRIVAVELDLDRLRHRGQVADQVLHQLRHLDVQARHLLLDLAADLVHHLVDRRARAVLQADEEVALCWLRSGRRRAAGRCGANRCRRPGWRG